MSTTQAYSSTTATKPVEQPIAERPAYSSTTAPKPVEPKDERPFMTKLEDAYNSFVASARDTLRSNETMMKMKLALEDIPPECHQDDVIKTSIQPGLPIGGLKAPIAASALAPRGSAFATTRALHLCPTEGQISTGATYTGVA